MTAIHRILDGRNCFTLEFAVAIVGITLEHGSMCMHWVRSLAIHSWQKNVFVAGRQADEFFDEEARTPCVKRFEYNSFAIIQALHGLTQGVTLRHDTGIFPIFHKEENVRSKKHQNGQAGHKCE